MQVRRRRFVGCSVFRYGSKIIAVPFFLSLSRIGEADNPGSAHATAKLFGEQFEASGQWTTNFTSKSEMELTPLLAQVGKCRQMFSEIFEKESYPYTLTVIGISLPLPVSTWPGGDSARTRQFSDYLFLFQVGKECDESRHVSAQMQFCDRSGREHDNRFRPHAKRGGRKHIGKKRKLEIADGVVNILQCNVTTWSEHAKHYILTSDFDATLISETHLEREKLVTAAKEARKFSWAGTGSAAIGTASNGTSVGVRTRWFSKPLSTCTDEAGVLCPTHDCGFRSDINANLMQDVCFLTRDGKLPFILGADFNFLQACGKTCPCMAAVFGYGSWEQQCLCRRNHTRAEQAKVKSQTSSIISWYLHSSDL